MKTKNFPNKKQMRRQKAYDNLVKRWNNKSDIPTAIKNEMKRLKELLTLGDLRHVRTKKVRGAR